MLILHITVAAFSVLGVYFSAKIIMGMLFPNEHLTRAVIIDEREKLLILDLILKEERAYRLCSYKNSIMIAINDVVFSSCSEDEKNQTYRIAEQRNAKILFF